MQRLIRLLPRAEFHRANGRLNRILKRIVGVCMLSFLSACGHEVVTSQPTSQWQSFRLNPELNAVDEPADPLQVRWTFKTRKGISSSPTISGDSLFVASNDHRLYALNLRTGRKKWVYQAANEIMSAPLVYDGSVIIGEGNNYSTNYDPPNYGLLADGANGLISVDAQTGKENWQYRLPGSAMPTGALVDGAIEEHNAAGMLFAIDAKTGRYRWRQYLGSVAAMSAANNFRGTEVVTAGDYPNLVISFDGTSGRILWRTEFADDSSAFADCPLASDGGAIYGMYFARPPDSKYNFVGFTTPGVEHAYAIEANTGRLIWDVPLVRGILPVNNHASIPMVSNGIMYVGSPVAPMLYALDASSGKVRWQLRVGGVVQGGLVAESGRLFFGDRAGFLWAVDAQDGAVIGKLKMKDSFAIGSPIIYGQTLFIGSKRGYVFALPIANIVAAKPT